MWYTQSEYTHNGAAAYRSGALKDNEQNWIETTVTGSGTISFWWFVSSEEKYDFLKFLVAGEVKESISGTSGAWNFVSIDVDGAGSHTLRWQYSKDGSRSAGLDAGFVSEIKWASTCQVTFNPNGGIFTSDASSGNKVLRMLVGKELKNQPALSGGGVLNVDRAGKMFAGWWTATSAGSRLSDDTVITGPVTYYARWN